MSLLNLLFGTDVGKLAEGGVEIIERQQDIGRDVLITAEQGLQDTARGVTKGLQNLGHDFTYTGRYGAKTVVALIDNAQDNLFQTVQDARTDIANTVQILTILVGTGVAAMFILYGDKILKQGVQFGGIELF